MISFATLFLGLVFGIVHVQLVAAPGVATVELRLDGRVVATVREPWIASIDLGPELAPHELAAFAFDAEGRPVGQARQWINRPRAHAEAGFVLEPGSGGTGRFARLTWRCLVREDPRSIRVSFDGRELPLKDPGRIELPPHAPGEVHFLRAELDFGDGVTAMADAAFGGQRKAEALTALTAVPVLLGPGVAEPTVEGLDGWLAADGAPVRAVGIEKGPARVVFVVEENALEALAKLRYGLVRSRGPWDPTLPGDVSFRFARTTPTKVQQRTDVVFVYPMSGEMSPRNGGILRLTSSLQRATLGTPEKIANAVGAAGLAAGRNDRRRAVVLLLGADFEDASDIPPEEVRLFLQRIGVPFFAWSVGRPAFSTAPRFGPAVDATTLRHFGNAVEALSDHLERQRIVWVEGEHLPQRIELTGKAEGLTLAR